MRSFATLAVLFAVMLCCSTDSSVGATVMFQDDYEGQTLGADLVTLTPPVGLKYYNKLTGLDQTQVVKNASTASEPGATNSGKFVGEKDPLVNTAIWHEIKPLHQAGSANGVIEFKMDAYIGSGFGDAGLELATFSNESYGGGSWDIRIGTNGSVWDYTTNYHVKAAAGTVARDQWVPLTIVADYAAQTYSATFGTFSFSGPFQTGSTAHDMLALYVSRNAAADNTVYYDNVSITYQGTIVPEPSALVLAAMGLLSLVAYAWRKRK